MVDIISIPTVVNCFFFVLGALGQKEFWDINNSSTYQYPLAPKDVLMDPRTIPDVLKKDEEMIDESKQKAIPMTVSDIEALQGDDDDMKVSDSNSNPSLPNSAH